MPCPLCHHNQIAEPVRAADGRFLWRCERCFLLFTDPTTHPTEEVARARYDTHNNSIEEAGYVAFLMRAITPALPHLQPGWRGLDFGSGPGPTLSKLLAREGMECDDYDPIYGPALDSTRRYDFVFATECFEHFTDPAREMALIDTLLNPGGMLTVMTERWDEETDLGSWYYPRDPTHVVFYHQKTFDWIAEAFGYTKLFDDGSRVVGMRKT